MLSQRSGWFEYKICQQHGHRLHRGLQLLISEHNIQMARAVCQQVLLSFPKVRWGRRH